MHGSTDAVYVYTVIINRQNALLDKKYFTPWSKICLNHQFKKRNTDSTILQVCLIFYPPEMSMYHLQATDSEYAWKYNIEHVIRILWKTNVKYAILARNKH